MRSCHIITQLACVAHALVVGELDDTPSASSHPALALNGGENDQVPDRPPIEPEKQQVGPHMYRVLSPCPALTDSK